MRLLTPELSKHLKEIAIFSCLADDPEYTNNVGEIAQTMTGWLLRTKLCVTNTDVFLMLTELLKNEVTAEKVDAIHRNDLATYFNEVFAAGKYNLAVND